MMMMMIIEDEFVATFVFTISALYQASHALLTCFMLIFKKS